MSAARQTRGFTILEVMIALAILALSLTMLLRSATRSLLAGEESRLITVATELARHKMGDIEDLVRKDGFRETDQTEKGDFGDEGWPQIKWEATIDTVELPSFDKLMQSTQEAATADAEANAEAAGGESGLGGMLSLASGMFGGSDSTSSAGDAFIQGQFELVKSVLKASIRKITLTLQWTVLGNERVMPVILYVTDAAGMQKTLGGFGATPDKGRSPSGGTQPGGSRSGGTGGIPGRGGAGGK